MKLKGALTITRVHSNAGPDVIRVALRDTEAVIEFAHLELSLEDFAKAITGLAYCPGELEVRGLDHVGKKHQNKSETVEVTFAGAYIDKKFDFSEALKGWEIDGWIADRHQMMNSRTHGKIEDLPNGLRRVKISTHFHRWVDA